jgi:glycosyltransferase involved in cell wall biosynthesis
VPQNRMQDFLEFGWKFFAYKLLGVFNVAPETNKFLFIVETGAEDWILGAKARRLSKNFPGESEVIFSKKFKNLPKAPGYFFLHQKYYAKALRFNPFIREKNCMVMFTHENWTKAYSKRHVLFALKNASKVICLNEKMSEELQRQGLSKEQTLVFHLASNPDFFPPKSQRQGKIVGFCCYYTDRKNPDLVLHLVKSMPDLKFILIGRNWRKYARFEELAASGNFTYYEDRPYEEYPTLYREMDVFVSPSFLEGGPVPLLEAMLSNVVPVASDTGFCPDLIDVGKNGFLFDPYEDTIEHIQSLVRQALELSGDIRQHVVSHSWENYGEKIYALHVADR